MNTQRLTSTYYDWTHGWHGFLVAYLIIALFSLAGLKRGHAAPQQYAYWPFTRQRPRALRRSLLAAQFARQATRPLSLEAT